MWTLSFVINLFLLNILTCWYLYIFLFRMYFKNCLLSIFMTLNNNNNNSFTIWPNSQFFHSPPHLSWYKFFKNNQPPSLQSRSGHLFVMAPSSLIKVPKGSRIFHKHKRYLWDQKKNQIVTAIVIIVCT